MAYTKRGKKDPESNKTGDEKIIEDARKSLRAFMDDEADERAKMLDDLRFCTLDQWPEDIRRERESDLENGPRPCLTIDKINQYIVQVVNDMRQGKPGIIVRPQDDKADIETAKILKGLVRNIEDQSNADIAYATAGENAAKMGLGYFRITTEYVTPDSFDQDIFIRPLPNTFAVYLGPHVMPDGSDAKKGFIVESMTVEDFKEQYPGKKWKEDEFDDLGEYFTYWRTKESVTVVECFYLERTQNTLYYLADGTTMTKADYDKWPEEMGVAPSIQEERNSYDEQLKWYKMTGVEILERRDLPGKYIPIVEVIGRESHVEGKRRLWGLVRPAKDSLRMYNYFASTITEKMGLAPKAPFIGAVGQFETAGDKWRKANRVNYAVLEYDGIDVNGNALPAPQRQGATPLEAALLNQMQVIEHDVQTSLGMFKAATGESESQQSGRAILALQRESDTGTYHFGANLGVSIRHAGRIIIGLIPHYYDTKRIARIIGEDGEVQTVQIDPQQEQARREVRGPQGIENIYNPSIGKYDISITVGPSYNTKRMEAAATFVEMAKGSADPASAAVLRYLVMRNSDFSGSDDAAKLLKSLLPPQALQAMESNEPIPPQVQRMLQEAQMKMAQANEALEKLSQENQSLKAGERVAMVKLQAQEKEGMLQAQLEKADADRKAQLETWTAQHKAQLAAWEAEQAAQLARDIAVAEHGIEQQKIAQKDVEISANHQLEVKKLENDMVPPEIVKKYKTDKVVGEESKSVLEPIQNALTEVAQKLQELSNRPQATKAEAIRTNDGAMRAVRITKSDGSVQEISTTLH